MKIRIIKKFNKEALKDLNKLLLQLSSSGYQATPQHFRKVLADKNTYTLCVYDGQKIVGMATLIMLNKLLGSRGRVEDVIIDKKYQGRGLGKKLMKELIVLAKKEKIYKLELKSETSRIIANKLYPRVGFERIDANVYQLKLK